jgi:hypothetical protein
VRKLVVNVGSTLLILFIILTSCRPQGMIPITGNEETTEPVAQQLEDVTPTPETSLAATTEGTVSQTAEIPVLTPTVEPEIISIESPTVVLTVTDTPTSKNTTDIPTETNITITPSVQFQKRKAYCKVRLLPYFGKQTLKLEILANMKAMGDLLDAIQLIHILSLKLMPIRAILQQRLP